MWKNLKQILTEEGLIDEKDLDRCGSVKELKDNNDEDYFLYFSLISEENLCSILSKKLSIEKKEIKYMDISKEAIDAIPSWMVYKYSIMPLYIDDGSFHVASINPIKDDFTREIKFILKRQLKIYISTKSDIMFGINKYYTKSNVNTVITQLEQEISTKKNKAMLSEESLKFKESPAVKLVDYIIKDAINQRASDIHFEPYEEKCRVRYRTDGYMKNIMELPKNGYVSLCSRLKILSGINIVESRVPQEGKINKDMYDFRVSTIPTVNGEKMVIRILYKNNFYTSLKDVGFDDNTESLLKDILKCGQGMVLFCGPTGSGKTSTLYTLLNYINKPNINIVTIEDPVEYVLHGINQINVNASANLSFASGLRSVLRQDPDVIMIGEIRDEETAQIAVRAALTGHLVLSTVHTNDAVGALTRLIDMGIPKYLLGDSLTAVISQRLVKKICPNCKKEYSKSADELKFYKIPESFNASYGAGCSMCSNTGYFGRTVCYEMIVMDKYTKNTIKDPDYLDKIRKYNEKIGNPSIQDNCIKLINNGITTVEELKRLSLFNM